MRAWERGWEARVGGGFKKHYEVQILLLHRPVPPKSRLLHPTYPKATKKEIFVKNILVKALDYQQRRRRRDRERKLSDCETRWCQSVVHARGAAKRVSETYGSRALREWRTA